MENVDGKNRNKIATNSHLLTKVFNEQINYKMEIEKYLKERLRVPINWGKRDYQAKRYSFEEMEEMATDLVKNFGLTAVVRSNWIECDNCGVMKNRDECVPCGCTTA